MGSARNTDIFARNISRIWLPPKPPSAPAIAPRPPPYQQGYALFRKPKIAEAIAELIQERSEQTQIAADRVLQKLARVAFANIYDFMRVGDDC
jgi:Terminase small subunit